MGTDRKPPKAPTHIYCTVKFSLVRFILSRSSFDYHLFHSVPTPPLCWFNFRILRDDNKTIHDFIDTKLSSFYLDEIHQSMTKVETGEIKCYGIFVKCKKVICCVITELPTNNHLDGARSSFLTMALRHSTSRATTDGIFSLLAHARRELCWLAISNALPRKQQAENSTSGPWNGRNGDGPVVTKAWVPAVSRTVD